MRLMSKRKKHSELFKTARVMGENVGRLVLESKKHSRALARKGRSGLETTAQKLKKTERKAVTTTKETIPQIMKEFKKGLKSGMKKR